jgi:hypothetical protein
MRPCPKEDSSILVQPQFIPKSSFFEGLHFLTKTTRFGIQTCYSKRSEVSYLVCLRCFMQLHSHGPVTAQAGAENSAKAAYKQRNRVSGLLIYPSSFQAFSSHQPSIFAARASLWIPQILGTATTLIKACARVKWPYCDASRRQKAS